jgi:hypothetical protein
MSDLDLHSGGERIPHFVRDDNFGEIEDKVGASLHQKQVPRFADSARDDRLKA